MELEDVLNMTEEQLSNIVSEFRSGSRISLDSNKVLKELIEVYKSSASNRLLPKEIVEYARNHPESELHKGFEWNDGIAAERYRQQQATQIVYNIRVVYDTNISNDKTEYKVNIMPFTHLDNDNGYESTVRIIKDEDKYAQLKHQAYNDLIYWRNKYSTILEFENIFKDIDKIKL